MSDINLVARALCMQHQELVTLWHEQGPEAAKRHLESLDPEFVQALVMAHVGAEATSF